MDSQRVCVTVDVEDFYEGMAALGHHVARPAAVADGMMTLLSKLESQATKPRLTLFVVARYAPGGAPCARAFATAGHEIASHGPDHGAMPTPRRRRLAAPGAATSSSSCCRSRCGAFARLASTCLRRVWRRSASPARRSGLRLRL